MRNRLGSHAWPRRLTGCGCSNLEELTLAIKNNPLEIEDEEVAQMTVYEAAAMLVGLKSLQISCGGERALPDQSSGRIGRLPDCIGRHSVTHIDKHDG